MAAPFTGVSTDIAVLTYRNIMKHREHQELSRSSQKMGNSVPNHFAYFASVAFQAPLLDQFAAKPAAADPAAPAGPGKGPLRRHDEPR